MLIYCFFQLKPSALQSSTLQRHQSKVVVCRVRQGKTQDIVNTLLLITQVKCIEVQYTAATSIQSSCMLGEARLKKEIAYILLLLAQVKCIAVQYTAVISIQSSCMQWEERQKNKKQPIYCFFQLKSSMSSVERRSHSDRFLNMIPRSSIIKG